jgi:8-amino-7-oxononanoate synthase
MYTQWFEGQKLKGAELAGQSRFLQMLETTLDARRRKKKMIVLRQRRPNTVDFASNDFLGLSSSGMLRERFLQELAAHPSFTIASGGSRLLDGTNAYVEDLEREIASFHKAESALLFNSGYEANVAIFASIPALTDVIIYDEFIHASVHVGMRHSRASTKVSFLHNDLVSFEQVLLNTKQSDPAFELGYRSVLIAIESVYSMDGDIAPVPELLALAKRLFPLGNAVFIIDEAQATGIIGPHGAGLISDLGLENEMAIRVHTYGKALSSNGGKAAI